MKWKTIIISGVVLLVLSFGGLFYYASLKINGEELRKFMVSSLEEAFPYANVDMGEVKIKLGSSLNLAVQGLSLHLADKKTELFEIDRVGINIPLWILLGFEQNITINLDGAYVNFFQSGEKSNWLEARKKSGKPETIGKTAMAPAFLAKGKINLKFTDTRINYNFEKKQKGEVLIKYFRVNNLGIKSDAAYELKSDISLKFSEQDVNMELSLVGQFSPAEFIQQGMLKTTSILTVNKMYLPIQDISVPGFKTDIKFELSNVGDITAKLATTLNDRNYINALVKTKNKELSVENIDIVFYLQELLDILKIEMPSLNVGTGRLELKGGLSLGSQFQPDIVFSIGPQVKYTYNNVFFSGDLKGKYQGSSLVMGMTSKGLEGSLYGDFSININLGKQPIILSQLPPFKLSVMANDLVVPAGTIQNILYATSDKEIVTSTKEEKKIFLLPGGVVDFNFKNVSLGGKPLSLAGMVSVANREIESKEIKITTSEGEGSASFKSRLYSEGSKSQFSVKLNNIDLKDFNGLFPPKMGLLEGVSSGSVEGTLGNLSNQLSYNTNLYFKIKNGHWYGMDLEQYTQKIINELSVAPLLRNKLKRKNAKIGNKFQEVFLKGVFAQEQWNLDQYYYVGNELSFKGGKGKIYFPPAKKKSFLTMDVDMKIFRSVMSKNFARRTLPLRLSGIGFMLKPDISFVSKKLARSHVKKRSKKLIQNLKNKVLKDSPESKKIKGFLKGVL